MYYQALLNSLTSLKTHKYSHLDSSVPSSQSLNPSHLLSRRKQRPLRHSPNPCVALQNEGLLGTSTSLNTTRPVYSKVRLASMPYEDAAKCTSSSGAPWCDSQRFVQVPLVCSSNEDIFDNTQEKKKQQIEPKNYYMNQINLIIPHLKLMRGMSVFTYCFFLNR